MNILITSHYLNNLSGSELYTYELANLLNQNGHNITVYSPLPGKISKKLEDMGIKFTSDLQQVENEKFDIINAQHNTTAILARSVFPQTPIVYTIHGIIPALEQPPSIEIGISSYIAVSREIKDYLIDKYQIKSDKIKIIPNLIDLERFKPIKSIKPEPRNLLVISNHLEEETRISIENACRKKGIKALHVGLPFNSVENIEDYINDADIVVTIGRGVVEALACERNVIVYDVHGGAGMLDEEKYSISKNFNFSGRGFKKYFTEHGFLDEIGKYNVQNAVQLRQRVLEDYNPNKLITQIESVYTEATSNKNFEKSTISKFQLFNELEFLESELYKHTKALDHLISESKALIKELHVLREHIKHIENSLIWKLSSPFRTAIPFLKRIFNKT